MLERLRREVVAANVELVERGLVVGTFGNASGVDRERGLVAIKPSGVGYGELKAEDLVVTDLGGRVVEGELRPSSDLETHLELYREFGEIGGVVHTHSEYATAWAQAGREIPALGTTHADYFHGAVPVTAELGEEEVGEDYVLNTGRAIVRRFREGGIDPVGMPGVLVAGHAPFTWGGDALEAAYHAEMLEVVARMAYYTVMLQPGRVGISQALLDRHHYRKHGAEATYGQGGVGWR